MRECDICNNIIISNGYDKYMMYHNCIHCDIIYCKNCAIIDSYCCLDHLYKCIDSEHTDIVYNRIHACFNKKLICFK